MQHYLYCFMIHTYIYFRLSFLFSFQPYQEFPLAFAIIIITTWFSDILLHQTKMLHYMINMPFHNYPFSKSGCLEMPSTLIYTRRACMASSDNEYRTKKVLFFTCHEIASGHPPGTLLAFLASSLCHLGFWVKCWVEAVHWQGNVSLLIPIQIHGMETQPQLFSSFTKECLLWCWSHQWPFWWHQAIDGISSIARVS